MLEINYVGIYHKLQKGYKATYSQLTLDDLKKAIGEFFDKEPVNDRPIQLVTSHFGKKSFEHSIVLEKHGVPYFTYHPHRLKNLIIFSLFEKHGLYKIKYDFNTELYTAYYGTQILKVSAVFEEVLNKIDDLLYPNQDFESIMLPGYWYGVKNQRLKVNTGNGGGKLLYKEFLKSGLTPCQAARRIIVHTEFGYIPLINLKIKKND